MDAMRSILGEGVSDDVIRMARVAVRPFPGSSLELLELSL